MGVKRIKSFFFSCGCRYIDCAVITRGWQVDWLNRTTHGHLCERWIVGRQTAYDGFHIWKSGTPRSPWCYRSCADCKVVCNSNVSMYVSTWIDRKICTGSRSILANKNSLLEKACVSLHRKYIHLQSDPRKAVGQPKSPPCAISTAAGRWGCYHAVATIVLCLMPIFTLLASIFPGRRRSGSKSTAPWSGGGYYSGSTVPRLW